MNLNYDEPLELMRATVEAAAEVPAYIGTLGAQNSLALVATGGQVSPDLAGNAFVRLQVQVNAKHRDQTRALSLLTAAMNALFWLEHDAEAWQLTGASEKRAPAYLGPDAQNAHIYAAQIEARLFYRSEA